MGDVTPLRRPGWPVHRAAPDFAPALDRSEAALDAEIERAMAAAANAADDDDADRRRYLAAAEAAIGADLADPLAAEWRAQTDPANASWRQDALLLAGSLLGLALLGGLCWAGWHAWALLAQALPPQVLP